MYTIAEGGTAIIAALPSFYMERKQMMETKTAAVSIRNVTKTFGSVIANDKVNLDIYKGEILALLGEQQWQDDSNEYAGRYLLPG